MPEFDSLGDLRRHATDRTIPHPSCDEHGIDSRVTLTADHAMARFGQTIGVAAESGRQIEDRIDALAECAHQWIPTPTRSTLIRRKLGMDTRRGCFTRWTQVETTLSLDQHKGFFWRTGVELDPEFSQEFQVRGGIPRHDPCHPIRCHDRPGSPARSMTLRNPRCQRCFTSSTTSIAAGIRNRVNAVATRTPQASEMAIGITN